MLSPKSLRDDAVAMLSPWVSDPRMMCWLHLVALGRTFVPRDGNNDFRKLTASVLMLVWSTISIGIAFDYATLGIIQYGAMTAVVYTIIGVQWGFQIVGVAPGIEINYRDDQSGQDGDD